MAGERYSPPVHRQAGVAQLVERRICNPQVTGSSPLASSTDRITSSWHWGGRIVEHDGIMGGLRADGVNWAWLCGRNSLANGSELEANRKLTGCSSARVETAPSRTRELEAEGAHTLFSVAAGRRHNGEVPKRSNGADCKSAGSCLRRFKSSPLHHLTIPASCTAILEQ